MNYRKITASISALAILATSIVTFGTTVATAATTFTDTSSIASWSSDAVAKLAAAGVIAGRPDGSFNPAGNLNRAEIAKIAVLGAKLTTDTTGAPHFNDVAPTDWFYPFVETLYNKGVVGGINNGALDKNGLATFNPAGTLNRAEAAKILVDAFGLEKAYAGKANNFSDVTKGAWYFDYVETAFAHGLVKGYANGSFGPSDAVTREQIAVIAQNSREEAGVAEGSTAGSKKVATYKAGLASSVATDTTTPTTPVVAASDGTLAVALSASSPAAATIAKGATGIVVASYDFTASSSGDVAVSGVTVKRNGVGARADIEALYLYDGTTKLTGSRTISADTNVAEFSNLGLTVAKGTTKTINVVADILYTAGGSDQHSFAVETAAAVVTNAKSVSGSFPVSGSTITIGGSAVGYIMVQSTGSVSNPTVGDKAVELAKFQLTAGANNVALKKFVLNNTGSAGSDKVSNLKLYQGSTEVATTVTRANDRFTFALTTPFAIANGTNKTFTVKGDVTGGLNSQTIIFNFEEKGDVQATDEVLGTNAITFDSGDTTSSNSYSNTALQTLTIKGGDVNLAFSGPAAKNVSKGAKDIKLWEGTLTVAAGATVKNTYVYLASSQTNGTSAGLCDNASTANFTDIKVINAETGSTLAGPVEYTCSTDTIAVSAPVTSRTTDVAAQMTLTDDWQVEAGKSYKLAITADVRNASGNDSNDVTATFGANGSTVWTSTDLKKNDASEYLTSIVPSTAIAGNKQTVLSSSLTVSIASTPNSTTLVKGAAKKDLLGLNLQAGTNSNVKVTQIKLYGDAGTATSDVDGTFAETGGTDVRAANVIQTAYLYDGSTLLSTKSFDTSTDAVTFDNISLTVSAGATKTLTVKGDVNSSLSTTTYFALDVSSLSSSFTSEDVDGNDITETAGARSSNISTGWSVTTAAMTLSPTGGTLTIASDADTPSSALVLMSTIKKEIYRAKVTAATEDFRIERLSFIADSNTNTSGDNDNNIQKVYLEYPDSLTSSTSTKTVEGTLSGGVVLFDITSTPMYVKKDQDARVKVYVDTTDSTSATSQEMIKFYLNLGDFKGYGEGSNVQQTGEDIRLGTSAGLVGSVAAATAFGFSGEALSEFNGANADTTDTTLAVDGSTNYKIGDIIRNNDTSEQMIVTANLTSAGTLSVLRGANGTTAAAISDNDDIDKLGVASQVATAATAAAVDTSITGLVASAAISRGDLIVGTTNGGSATTDKATFVATSNQASGVTAALPIVTAATSSSKLTGVTNTTARLATDDFYKLTNYRTVSGNFFSVARSTATAALASSSPSGSRTTAAKDNVLSVTFANGGSFASTISSLTFSGSGSLIDYNDGGGTPTIKVYDNSALNDSDLVLSSTMTAIDADGSLPATTFTSFSKTIEIAANSSKTLYVVLDTTYTDGSGDKFTTTSSDDLLTVSMTAYKWSDGVNTFTASDTGYGITLPVNGNTLRY